MNIYIPKHLRKLKIVEQLCQLIVGYSEYKKEEESKDLNTSLDSEYYYNKYKTLSYDPVKKFVGICIALEEDVENVLKGTTYISEKTNYVTEVFYNLGGSYKIFDMLKTLLDFEFDVNYQIDLGYLQITVSEATYNRVFKINEELYGQSFIDFLSSLLYFKKAEITFEKTNIELEKTNNVVTVINNEPILYNYFNL